MNSPNQHVSVGLSDQTGVSNTVVNAQKVANTLAGKNQIAEEVLIALKDWQIVISQKWLATQPPPPSFIREGWEIYDQNNEYWASKKNPNKMQCWLRNDIYYWNKKARDWLAIAKQWKILSKFDLYALIKINQWINNTDTMEKMWIARTWYCNPYSGQVYYSASGIVQSDSMSDDGYIQIFFFHLSETVPAYYWMSDWDGSVPFIVKNQISV